MKLMMNLFLVHYSYLQIKNRRNIKVVYWDKTGFAMWTKILEKEKFPWPKNNQLNQMTLNQEQFY